MKKQMRSLLLIAIMLTCLLSACGDNTASASQTEPTAELVYQAETLSLGEAEAYEISYVNTFCVSGNQLFFAAACVTGTKTYTNLATGETVMDPDTGEPRQVDVEETLLFRMDLDTQETVRLEPYQPLEVPEGQLGSVFLLDMAAGADGTVWTMENMNTFSYDLPEDFDAETGKLADYLVPGEVRTELRQHDAEGQLLQTLTLDAAYPQQLLLDQSGNFYIRTENAICLLDSQGTLLAELDNSDGSELFQISGTEIGILEKNAVTGVTSLRLIDPAAGDFGEKRQVADGVSSVYPGFGDYQYLYSTGGDTVYGFNAETGEGETLFSQQDSGISGSVVDDFAILDDGRVIALSWDSAENTYALLSLGQVEASAQPQIKELTLAGMLNLTPGYTSPLQDAVTRFNRTHEDVKIVLKDYWEYTDGRTLLNTEILSGNMPDILYFDGMLPVDQYASMGLLTDLWPLIDSDEELSRDDLMTHLFDVLSTGDQLYQVTGSFYIETAVGNTDILGDQTGWTVEEMLEAREAVNPDASIFGGDSKKSVLSTLIGSSLSSYMDWETQTCSFDSDPFIALLNFANAFPDEAEWESTALEDTRSRFLEGEQLLLDTTIQSFADIKMASEKVGGNPCYVGYPSSDGSGSRFQIMGGLGITTACQDVDLAWSFVRTVLMEDYIEINEDFPTAVLNQFPANRHAFETLVETVMTPMYQVDPSTGEYEIDPETGEKVEFLCPLLVNGDQYEFSHLTQEEYDTFMRLYKSCNTIDSYDSAVYSIIVEEAEPFFDGQKTAEEAAILIQNRVGLYMMEQG